MAAAAGPELLVFGPHLPFKPFESFDIQTEVMPLPDAEKQRIGSEKILPLFE